MVQVANRVADNRSHWLAIRVELVDGNGERFWPRPGRVLAASRKHSFATLATAIDDAFGRWDRGHLHEFWLPDGRCAVAAIDDELEDDEIEDASLELGIITAGDRFLYEFDLGACWKHLCTVEEDRVDPIEAFGHVPDSPIPLCGWGSVPDKYGRRWADDDGVSGPPKDLGDGDLPVLGPWKWRSA